MNRFLSRVFIIFLIGMNTGWAVSHRKIQYTVELENRCKDTISEIFIYNDNKYFLPGRAVSKLYYHTPRSYNMPMTIPDISQVFWKDSQGIQHKEQIPLRSLIHFSDYFGHSFEVVYHFCDGELQVIFAKKKTDFEYDYKEIWTNKKKHARMK